MSVGLIPFLLNPILANIYYSLRTVKNIIAINLFFIMIQFIVLLFFSKIFTGIETLTVTWVIIVWTNNFALIYFLAHYKDLHFDKTIVMKLFLVLLTTAALIMLCKNFVDVWFGEANALQSNLHLLLKVSGAGIILLLVFTIGISFVFYDRLDEIIHYFKKNRE
jgi:peptidoglycan biosynthesis protein MviN/MurJ (putative lipid II flippase)